jgi:hypothetical protein
MAAIGDDLRLGAVEVMRRVRRDVRSVVAYATGAVLIAASVLFRDFMPYRGVGIGTIGGALIAIAIFLPPIANRLIGRLRHSDITAELADLENAWLNRFATQEQRWRDEAEARDQLWAQRLDELTAIVRAARDQLR